MASTFPNSTLKSHLVKNRALLTTPAPPFLLLFLLLLLSLLLALFLLHINDLLLHSDLSHTPPFLHHFLSPLFSNHINYHPSPLPSSTLVQHYLTFVLSPFRIFILANLIIFTLLFKTFYLSSSPSISSDLSANFSEFSLGKFDYGGGPRLPEYAVARHEDFFFSSPPDHARYILSSDPSEEYVHVLSFGSSEESTYSKNMQSFNKLNNEGEQVKRVYMGSHIDGSVVNGNFHQKEAKRQDKVQVITEKVQLKHEERAAEKGGAFQDGKVDGKTCRSLKGTASECSPAMPAVSQAVVINMVAAPAATASRRPRTTPPQSHPPSPTPQQPSIKVTHPQPSASMQRPPSSPRAKKSLPSGVVPTSDSRSGGARIAAKPLISESDKQAPTAKPTRSTNQLHESPMIIRSYSDQRLSQQNLRPSSDVGSSSSSITNRPPHSVPRGRSAIDNLLTSSSLTASRPRMQRTQSLKASSTTTPAADYAKSPSSSSPPQVTRSTSFSQALDALSHADANKHFSDFIAHRFSLMKKELDAHSST